MSTGFHLKLLGEPALLGSDASKVRLRTRKQLALLVYLRLEKNEQRHPRDFLAELLWPEVSRERGRHSLAQALSALRSIMGAEAFDSDRAGVRLVLELRNDLDGTVQVPARPPQPLARLEEVAGSEFAHWVERTRSRLLRELRRRLSGEVRDLRSKGEMGAVFERAETLYRLDPLSHEAVLALADQALLRGDSTLALTMLEGHAERCRSELDAQLPPSLTEKLRRIRLSERVPTERATETLSVRPDAPFVGRKDELKRLEGAWQKILSEQRLRAVLLSGPAGIGKTSVGRTFVDSLRRRRSPAFALTCHRMGSRVPFAAAADLIASISQETAVSAVDPTWLAEASRVYPELRRRYPGIPRPSESAGASVKLRIAEALNQMLAEIASESSVLVFVDDIQNLDPASADILHLASRRLWNRPVLLLTTARSLERQLFQSLTEGLEESVGEVIELTPLDRSETLTLVRGCAREAVSDEVANAIFELSQGNPYLTELLGLDAEENGAASLAETWAQDRTRPDWRPSDTMRLAFSRQYDDLSDDERHLLHYLAVADRGIPADSLGRLLKGDLSRWDTAVLVLLDRGILRIEEGSIALKNELHRAFVYRALLTDEKRRYYHALVARTLLDHREPSSYRRHFERSHHLAQAGLIREAATAVREGANRAISQGAPKEAELALKAVRREGERSAVADELAVLLARSLAGQGLYRESLEVLDGVHEERFLPGDRGWAAALRAECLHKGGLATERTALAAADLALSLTQGAEDPDLILSALQVRAELACDRSDFTRLGRIEERVHRLKEQLTDSRRRGLAELTQGYCLLVSGKHSEAKSRFEESSRSLAAASSDIELKRAQNGLGICQTALGQYDDAERSFRSSIALSARIGDALAESNGWDNLGSLFNDLGYFSDAASSFNAAMTCDSRASVRRGSADIYNNAAWLAVLLGSFSEADQYLSQASKRAREVHLWRQRVSVLISQADLMVMRSEFSKAWELTEEAIAITGNRIYYLGEIGRFERLRRHFLLMTRGFETMATSADNAVVGYGQLGVADRLEVSLFMDWARSQHFGKEADLRWTEEMVTRGLAGLLGRMYLLGLTDPPARIRQGEPIAQLIARVFPHPRRAEIPPAVVAQE